MQTVEPEWDWTANCPECATSAYQYDENVEEEYRGDDSLVTCNECGTKFIVKVSN